MGLQRDRFHGRWQYLFIESICNDTAVLEQNYKYKMMYSPDYTHSNSEVVRFAEARRSFAESPFWLHSDHCVPRTSEVKLQ